LNGRMRHGHVILTRRIKKRQVLSPFVIDLGLVRLHFVSPPPSCHILQMDPRNYKENQPPTRPISESEEKVVQTVVAGARELDHHLVFVADYS
jgi:hypothetical protein